MKNLKYWKNNCEEDYIKTPISVLRYITELENKRKLLFCECLNNFDIYQETKIYLTSCNKEVKIIRTK